MKTKPSKSLFKSTLILAPAALFLATASVQAQIGSNWQEYSPDSKIQIEVHDVFVNYPANATVVNDGGVRYTNQNGIETFCLANNDSNRVERRYFDDYTDRRQFQGDIKVSSPTDNEIVHQVFCANPDGPYLAIVEHSANGGNLKGTRSGSATLSGIYGTWVRVNSIHDKAANITELYLNGSKIWSGDWGTGISYYTKYGCYGTLQTSMAMVQYKNIKMFKTGVSIDTTAIYHLQNEASGLSLNQQGSLTNGSKITQWSSTSTSPNLQWKFIATDSGYYQINSVTSGKDAVVQSASTSQGAGIIQWSFGSSQNDQWKPTQNSDGSYTFVNRHSGLVLEDPGSSTSTSTQMDQWGSNGGANQKWKLVKQ